MKSPKVRIYIRIRRTDSTNAFVRPVRNRNGSLRGGYAIVNGVPEHHAEGTYYLRYKLEGERRQWIPVGGDPERALVTLNNTEHDLQAISLGREAPGLPSAPAGAAPDMSLEAQIEEYLDEVRKLKKSDKTYTASKNMLKRFGVGMKGKPLREITRDDLINYGFTLGQSGLVERTVHNHLSRSEPS